MPQIEVTFDIDANGIVNVSAKDLGTGREQHITITAGSNMSEEEINKAVKEAAAFEAQDKRRKEGVDARNEADSMVFQTENALKEVGDKVSADDKAKVQAEIDSLKNLLNQTANVEEMTDTQINDLKAGKAETDGCRSGAYLRRCMRLPVQNASGNAGPNPGAGAAGGSGTYQNNDDVVDADYKEV